MCTTNGIRGFCRWNFRWFWKRDHGCSGWLAGDKCSIGAVELFMWRCSFLCPVRLTIAISSVIAALWLLGGKTGAGVRGILSRESSVTRPANPGEASMDYVHCICLAGVTKLDGNQWSIVLKYWKLLASWKEAPTLQGLTCRTELGCRWSGVISIPSSLPPLLSLSLSSSSSYSLILNDHSMESEYRLFVLFPSLSLCDLLIVMACRWATNPPWHAKSPSLLPPTGWRTYKTRSCRKSDIWNFHMLLHTIILLLSKSCREVDCLFSVPFYATYLLLLHHGLGFECSPETGSCKREVLWLC